ncbi:MAG TPA: hypothetical protein VFJ77_03770 [Gaiellaceae bacterium]|nr:hypothetical protein [Gaiellaceae bacterium]
MATILSEDEVVYRPDELPVVPLPPNASITAIKEPGVPGAADVLAHAQAEILQAALMKDGYREMAADLAEWSETTLAAQSEILSEE